MHTPCRCTVIAKPRPAVLSSGPVTVRERAGRSLAALDEESFADRVRALAAQLEDMGDAPGWITPLRVGLAGALAEQATPDDLARAVTLLARVLDTDPTHERARNGLVEALHRLGRTAEAVEAGREGLRHLPGNMRLLARTAQALRDHEGPGAAAAWVAASLGADPTRPELDLAIALARDARQADGAGALCRALLGHDPAAPLAHLALIEGALKRGDRAAARTAAQAALAHAPDHPELRLRIAQGLLAGGEATLARATLEALPPGPAHEAEVAALRDRAMQAQGPEGAAEEPGPWPELAALEAALAAGDAAGLDRSLGACLSARALPWYGALRLVACASRAGRPEIAAALVARFDAAGWSETDRQAFEIEQRLLCAGPRAALDRVRAQPVARRDAEAAERLGRVLLAGGGGPLAARYLRTCRRRWPEDRAIAALAVLAEEACGIVQGAGPSRLALAREGASLPRVAEIEACLLTGKLPEAEALLARLPPGAGALEAALVHRPRATRVGSLLNEARILAAAGIDWTGGDLDRLARLAEGFFLPARRLLDAQGPAPRDGDAQAGPPEAVHLVWPFAGAPGAEAERLFAAWRAATRRPVTVHGLAEGVALVAEAGGDDALRVFRGLPEAAQRADMLMLALAVTRGGAVVSAGQWPSGRVDALLDGARGARVFRDVDGSVCADALLLPAGHALARRALAMLVASGRAGDRDHRWFGTGPGLLTRAAALHLGQGGARAAPVALSPVARLRRHMHPHATVVPAPEAAAPDPADALLVAALERAVGPAGPVP